MVDHIPWPDGALEHNATKLAAAFLHCSLHELYVACGDGANFNGAASNVKAQDQATINERPLSLQD